MRRTTGAPSSSWRARWPPRCGPRPDASDGAGSPRLVDMREPDRRGAQRPPPQLAFGLGLVEPPDPPPPVAADDDRTPAGLEDDHLHAGGVARRRDESQP